MTTKELHELMLLIESKKLDEKTFKKIENIICINDDYKYNILFNIEGLLSELIKIGIKIYEKTNKLYFDELRNFQNNYSIETLNYINNIDFNLNNFIVILNNLDLKGFDKKEKEEIIKYALNLKDTNELDYFFNIMNQIKNIKFKYNEEDFLINFINGKKYSYNLLDISISLKERNDIFLIIKDILTNTDLCNMLINEYYRYNNKSYVMCIKNIYLKTNINLVEDISIEETIYRTELYFYLLNYISFNELQLKNFFQKNSYSYKLLFDETIDLKKRYIYFKLICHKNIIMKDKIIKIIADSVVSKGIEEATIISYMLRNNRIRRSKICKYFILKENNLEVLKQVYELFKINESTKGGIYYIDHLSCFKNSEDRIFFINKLIEENTFKMQKRKEKKEEKVYNNIINLINQNINELYNEYLLGESSYDELKNALKELNDQGLILELKR